MRSTVLFTLAVILAAMSPLAMAQASAPETPATQPPKAPSDKTMKSMQEMHAKMMAAKTAEERQALMGEHMKSMQDGMARMGQMKGEKGGMSPDAMAKRMDMMEMMMMDREVARTPVTK